MTTTNRIGLLRGEEFQKFCSVLLSAEDPSFQAVNGAGGDLGNDGFQVAGNALYQAYAPDKLRAGKLRAKIADSVAKAAGLRTTSFPHLAELVLLTPFDLTHPQHAHLQKTSKAAGLTAVSWGESRLLALLTKHPRVTSEFPTILLPDLVQEIRKLAPPPGPTTPPTYPNPNLDKLLFNMRRDPFAYWYIVVATPALALPTIEPEVEDSYRDAVRERFWEDNSAGIARADGQLLVVEHCNRESRRAFHRHWARYAEGAIVMAASLQDLYREKTYSAADMCVDLTRFLQLAAAIVPDEDVRLTMGFTPGTLTVAFDPSDRRARERLGARLGGIGAVRVPVRSVPTDPQASSTVCTAVELGANAHALVARLAVPLLRQAHDVRISMTEFAASIPGLIVAEREAQRF